MTVFKKADEMETHIAFLSMRITWVFTTLALLAWSWYDFFYYNKLNYAFIIVATGGVIYWLTSIYYKFKMR
ncbi:MAG: hypothetical protein GX295_03705 [Syntrophomonadaceae bacterium]|nr:hypothetical protein [Syntrophomonadaceae bacterium]